MDILDERYAPKKKGEEIFNLFVMRRNYFTE